MFWIGSFGRKHRHLLYRNSSTACVWMCVYISIDTEKTWAYIFRVLWRANSKKNEQVYSNQWKSCNACFKKTFRSPKKKNTPSLASNFGFHLEDATLRDLNISKRCRFRAWGTAGPQQYSLWKLVQQKKYSNLGDVESRFKWSNASVGW